MSGKRMLPVSSIALAEAHLHSKHDFNQDFEFIDDARGRVPDHELTVMARKLEMDFFWKSFISTKLLHDNNGTRGRKIAFKIDWLAAN